MHASNRGGVEVLPNDATQAVASSVPHRVRRFIARRGVITEAEHRGDAGEGHFCVA